MQEKFFDHNSYIDKKIIRDRIILHVNGFGWQNAIANILQTNVPFNELKVIEVGCGTGTFSLTLNLLGANTTLLDADEDALNIARQVFNLYGRISTFVKADATKPVPKDLIGKFDVVLSGGLAEHFIGSEREQCFLFHKNLLNNNGMAYIGVPNKYSIFYRIVRYCSEKARKWNIDIEIPFSYWELKDYAEKIGFYKSQVIGNHSLLKDMRDYSLAFISVILKIMPSSIRQRAHVLKNKIAKSANSSVENQDEWHIIFEKVESIKKQLNTIQKKSLKDYLSAGLVLFGNQKKI